MKICYFGDYDAGYSRNRVIIKGLKENDVTIFECGSKMLGFKKLCELYKKHKRIKNKYDIMIIGYSDSRFIIFLAKILTRKKIIWDAFYSLYDSWVYDRKLVSKYSPKAWLYWLYDWFNCVLADKILLDTDEHINYFVKTFKINRNKFIKILVGTDDNIFYPREQKKDNKFIVHFHGNYIPLQGAEYIIGAAQLIKDKDILFRMVGSKGQKYKEILSLAKKMNLSNIEFLNSVPYHILPELMAKVDVCLGVFGDTDKTKRVIPNKVYEAIAMEKPVITANTPAAQELFVDKKNILFCETANSENLAKKIKEIKNNKILKNNIAKNGYDVFKNKCRPKILIKDLLKQLSDEFK
ncbi:glycosyltransferase [Candidatus Parcubacteria bacterium]|nr:glycosyltransferase [Candidatus Parcubacteria bacterium]